eukprot:gene56163-25143_t
MREDVFDEEVRAAADCEHAPPPDRAAARPDRSASLGASVVCPLPAA